MKVYDLFTELSSEKRLAILQVLDEKPMKFTSLLKEIEMTSPEASRQLNRLSDAKLIEKKGDGKYYNTLFGKLVLSCMPNLNFVSTKSEYFLEHDTAPIPQRLLSQIDALSTGVIVTGVYEILGTYEKYSKNSIVHFWYMSDDFPRHHLPLMEKHLDAEMEIKAILPKDMTTTLLPTSSEKMSEKIEIRGLYEVKISVIVSDNFSMLGLPGPDGKIDQNTAIFGYDDRFRAWCNELFQYYWKKAEPINV